MPVDQDQLRDALRRGAPLVLGDGSRPELPPSDGHPADRVVQAEDIRAVLLDAQAADPRGLILEGVLILGILDLNAAVIPYQFAMRRCRLVGPLYMEGAHLKSVFSLRGTAIDGQNQDGVSLFADRLQVEIYLAARPLNKQRFETTGSVRLLYAQVAGQLSLSGAELGADRAGVSLYADGLQVDGDLIAPPEDGHRFHTSGSVRLLGAHVSGLLHLGGAELGADLNGVSLDASELQVGGGVTADADTPDKYPFHSSGSMALDGARLSRYLNLAGADLGKDLSGVSLTGNRLHVEGDLISTQGDYVLRTAGSVHLVNAEVDGQLVIPPQGGNAVIANSGTPYELEGLQAGSLSLESGQTATVDLTGSSIRRLMAQTGADLPTLKAAQALSVVDVHGVLLDNRRVAEQWLASIPSSQPMLELAAVYERHGKPADARWLRYRAAVLGTQRRPLGSWLLRSIYRWLVGYGYYPLAALLWIAVILGLSSGLAAWQGDDFTTATTATIRTDLEHRLKQQQAGQVTATPPIPDPVPGRAQAGWWTQTWDVPRFQPFFYALSSSLPVAAAPTSWTPPDGWVAVALALLRLVAWTLTALFLAGVTGLLRKG